MNKKTGPAYIERIEEEFAAASPAETAALVRRLSRLKRKLARGK